jgi:predicted transcriptional regulator
VNAVLKKYPILGYLSQVGKYKAVPGSTHIEAYHLFREMLTDLRRKKGLTQASLAGMLGVPQSYVSKYELGERRVDLVETLEICRALDTDPITFVRELIKTAQSKGAPRVASPRTSPRCQR